VGPSLDRDLVALVALSRRLLPHVADELDLAPPRGGVLEADHHPAAAHERAIAYFLLPVPERDLHSIASARARGPGFGQQVSHPRRQLRVRRAAAHQACRCGRVGGATSVEGAAAASARVQGAAAGARAATRGASGGKLRTNLNLNAVRPEKRTLHLVLPPSARARGLGLGGRATTSWARVLRRPGL
jgi:hypothetical protein